MKRSRLRKPAPPRRPALRLTPLACTVRYAVVAQEVQATPKDAPARSESYRRWVATLGCARCGILSFSQAAHPNSGRGLGQKASDLDCFPLCCTRPAVLGCHAEHDQLIGMTLEERRAREVLYIARTRALAIQAGRPELQP